MSMSQMINDWTAKTLASKLGLEYDNIIYPDRMVHVAWTLFCLVAGFRLLQTSGSNLWQQFFAVVLLLFFTRSVMGPVSVKELTPDSIVKLQQFFDEDEKPKEGSTPTTGE